MIQVKDVFAELPAPRARAIPRAGLPGLGALQAFVQHNCVHRALGRTPMDTWMSCSLSFSSQGTLPSRAYNTGQSTQEVYFNHISSRQDKEKTTGETIICQDTSMLDPSTECLLPGITEELSTPKLRYSLTEKVCFADFKSM